MANVVNRTTKQYLKSVNTPDYPTVDWIINPDLSAVTGFATKYWVISGDTISLMTQSERDAVDAAEAAAQQEALREELKLLYDSPTTTDKAIVLALVDEVNTLRAALDELKTKLKPNALDSNLTYDTSSQRTPAQARTAVRNKVDLL